MTDGNPYVVLSPLSHVVASARNEAMEAGGWVT